MLSIGLALCALVTGLKTFQIQQDIQALLDNQKRIEQEVQLWAKEKELLEEKLESLNNPIFMEHILRDKLGVVRSGETMIPLCQTH